MIRVLVNLKSEGVAEEEAMEVAKEVRRRLGRGTRGKRGRGKLCEIVSQPQSEPSTCATSSKDTSSDENDSESDVVCPVCKFPESNDN